MPGTAGGQASASASRAAYLERLGSVGFDRLLGKIEAAHAQVRHSRHDSGSAAGASMHTNVKTFPPILQALFCCHAYPELQH